MKYKSIDLFAGIGGIRLGFENAFRNDIETVFVSEWDEKAQETYKTNFHDDFVIAGDITKISEKDVPDFDICLAGFPCQAFSIAGKKLGFDDDYKGTCRGTLFLDVARICDYHKPKVIFCENVKGLYIHDKGNTFRIICETFEKLGYKVFHKVLNSKDFGVPQNRERVYIVAFRNDIAPETFEFPVGYDDTKRIYNIIENAPVPAKYYLSDVYLETLKNHKARHAAKGNGFGYEIRSLGDIAGAIVCGGMGRERNLIIDNRQKDLIPTTHIKGKINSEYVRKMTPREWARLQGFPDSYSLPLADTHMYKQFGNSVTVNVIEAIAKKIREVLYMSEDKKLLKGNRGEWSEVYVFLRLLDMGRLYAADEELNKIDSVFYDILKIIRNEQIGQLEFQFNKDIKNVTVVNTKTGEKLISMSSAEFKANADELYSEIIRSTKTTFELPSIEAFLNSIYVKTLKAKSEDKADIRIRIHDVNSGYEAVQGFSIKSRLGSPSTLINAGTTTNFIYKVTGNISDDVMEGFNTVSKHFKDKFEFLKSNDCKIEFTGMENETFENNLILIDGDLPDICASLLSEYYMNGIRKVSDCVEKITKENVLNYNSSKGHPFYSYKFKKFITECALGMLPGKVWDGTADATGGYIIVREDGEVLCYHLFNRNEFENYLLNNTKFETASTSRHKFGVIYKENNEYYIKLNLQVRFIK